VADTDDAIDVTQDALNDFITADFAPASTAEAEEGVIGEDGANADVESFGMHGSLESYGAECLMGVQDVDTFAEEDGSDEGQTCKHVGDGGRGRGEGQGPYWNVIYLQARR